MKYKIRILIVIDRINCFLSIAKIFMRFHFPVMKVWLISTVTSANKTMRLQCRFSIVTKTMKDMNRTE